MILKMDSVHLSCNQVEAGIWPDLLLPESSVPVRTGTDPTRRRGEGGQSPRLAWHLCGFV